MADEATEAPAVEEDAQDTPEPAEAEAPEKDTPEASDTETVDYEQRYNDLRPEYDRSNQILSALQGRQGPEAQAEAARMFGFEFAEEDEKESDEDAYRDPDERMDALEKQLKEREEEAEEQEFQRLEDAWIQQELGKVAKDEGRDLSEEEKDVIQSFALSHRHEDGQPDIEGGHKKLQAIYSTAQKRLIDSKKNAPKPPSGAAGEPTIDTSTLDGRRKAIAEIASAYDQQE